jgi:hypothetical protein
MMSIVKRQNALIKKRIADFTPEYLTFFFEFLGNALEILQINLINILLC